MSVPALRLAPLDERYLPQILDIEKVSNSAPWSERSFRNELDHAQSIFRVAMQGDQVVGYGGLWLIVDEAHITTLAVAPESRGQGIGRRLMLEILNLARAQGVDCATLEVRARNHAAIHLYERLGFESVAIRKGYYPDNKEDAVVMWNRRLAETLDSEGAL